MSKSAFGLRHIYTVFLKYFVVNISGAERRNEVEWVSMILGCVYKQL